MMARGLPCFLPDINADSSSLPCAPSILLSNNLRWAASRRDPVTPIVYSHLKVYAKLPGGTEHLIPSEPHAKGSDQPRPAPQSDSLPQRLRQAEGSYAPTAPVAIRLAAPHILPLKKVTSWNSDPPDGWPAGVSVW